MGFWHQIGKPIALLFDENWPIFWLLGDLLKRSAITLEIWDFWHQIGKPIALLFDENWHILVAWRFSEEMQLHWKYGHFWHQKVSL